MTVSSDRAEEVSKRILSRLRRTKIIKLTAIGVSCLIILGGAAFSILYYFTDAVTQPHQGVNSNSLPGEWAMFGRDLGHSSTTASVSTLPQGTQKWVFSTGGAIHSSPAVADGTVFVGSRDGKLYALDTATGAKRWEFETGSWVESSPAIAGGVVYFGSNDGRLYAIDADNGEKLWEFKTKYPVMSSPAVADGIVYFGAEDYYVYALDAMTGEKVWEFNAKGPVKSPPTVANGIVYVGSGSDFCYALNALNGRPRLRFKSYYPVFSSPAVSDGTVYFSNANGQLYAVDGKARTWPREHEFRPFWIQMYAFGLPVPRPPVQSGLLWGLRVGRTSNSSPVVANDTLYLGAGNRLVAIDLQSRQRRWAFSAEGVIRSSAAVAETTVYVGSDDGRLYAIDATTGKKLWDFLTEDKIRSSPAVADGTVYVGSHDGNLYAIK